MRNESMRKDSKIERKEWPHRRFLTIPGTDVVEFDPGPPPSLPPTPPGGYSKYIGYRVYRVYRVYRA